MVWHVPKLASNLNKKQDAKAFKLKRVSFYIISTNWFIVTVVSDLGNTVLKLTPLSDKRRIKRLYLTDSFITLCSLCQELAHLGPLYGLKHSLNSDAFKQVNTTCEKYKMVLEKRFWSCFKQLSFRSIMCIAVNLLYSRIFIDFEQGSRISLEYNSSCSFSLPYFALTIILRSPLTNLFLESFLGWDSKCGFQAQSSRVTIAAMCACIEERDL